MAVIRAASVQFQHTAGEKELNLDIITDFTRQAAGRGVSLLVFPECCITGYWHLRRLTRSMIEELAEEVPNGPSCRHLANLAARYNITIGAGLVEIDDFGIMYNTYIIAMPDGAIVKHRKLHCFISEFMHSGDAFTVFDLPDGTPAGILICYDNNIIENVRITALKGAKILLAPHQTGGCKTSSPCAMGLIDPVLWERRHDDPEAIEAEFRGEKGREWLMRWLPSRAHDNGMFLIFSNGVGNDDGEIRTGNAMILDPYGRILNETWKGENVMITADLDLDLIARSTGQRWIRTRRPELFGTLAVPTGREEDTRTVRFE